MLQGKELIKVGFDKIGGLYHIDAGSKKRVLKTLVVNLDSDVRLIEDDGFDNRKTTELYNVIERGELTAWMLNEIYFMLTEKHLGLKEK